MYAVIETGGKQYRVELGSELEIDRLDVTPGETIDLGRVLLVADGDRASVGRPIVEGARVSANVVRQDRGEKLVVFKYRPKARRRVKHGHRQELTIVRVADIEFDGRSAAHEAQTKAEEQERARAAAARAAERQAAADRALAEKLAREQAEAEAVEEAKESPAAGKAGRRRKAPAAGAESKSKSDQPASDQPATAKPETAAKTESATKPKSAKAAKAETEPTTKAEAGAEAAEGEPTSPSKTKKDE